MLILNLSCSCSIVYVLLTQVALHTTVGSSIGARDAGGNGE